MLWRGFVVVFCFGESLRKSGLIWLESTLVIRRNRRQEKYTGWYQSMRYKIFKDLQRFIKLVALLKILLSVSLQIFRIWNWTLRHICLNQTVLSFSVLFDPTQNQGLKPLIQVFRFHNGHSYNFDYRLKSVNEPTDADLSSIQPQIGNFSWQDEHTIFSEQRLVIFHQSQFRRLGIKTCCTHRQFWQSVPTCDIFSP